MIKAVSLLKVYSHYVTIEKNNSSNVFCMGTIADLYINMGGHVKILGKPNKEIYIESTRKISKLNLSRTIAIGDSLDHDILGANNFEIDSVLISSGIHKELFKEGLQIGLSNIEKSNKWESKPTFLCSNFST